MIKGKKILITGGMGFIGSHLTENLINGNEITLLDNGRRDALKFLPKEIQKEVKIIKADIRDADEVVKAVKGKDIVFHLAAIAGASFYEKDPLLTIEVNLFGSANLFASLVGSNVQQVIDFSSSEVYGPNANKIVENGVTAIGPAEEGRWSYAMSKLASEHIAYGYFKKYQLPIVTVRPFNIYGPRQVGEGAVSNMIKNALTEGKIFVTGDGKQGRAWCYIDDFIQGMLLICSKGIVGETFNLGNPREYFSTKDLAEEVQRLNPEANIIFIDGVKSEIHKRLPNINKAKKLLGFTPTVDLKEGLKKSFVWYSENLDLL